MGGFSCFPIRMCRGHTLCVVAHQETARSLTASRRHTNLLWGGSARSGGYYSHTAPLVSNFFKKKAPLVSYSTSSWLAIPWGLGLTPKKKLCLHMAVKKLRPSNWRKSSAHAWMYHIFHKSSTTWTHAHTFYPADLSCSSPTSFLPCLWATHLRSLVFVSQIAAGVRSYTHIEKDGRCSLWLSLIIHHPHTSLVSRCVDISSDHSHHKVRVYR